MKTGKCYLPKLLAGAFLGIIILFNQGCSEYISEPMDLDVVYVGILNDVQKFPTSGGTLDAIYVENTQYEEVNGLDPAYRLQWDGNAFSATYTDVYTSDANKVMTTVVSISGVLSSNYKTLVSFNGSRTFTQSDPGGYNDITEQRIELQNVPLEKDEDMLSVFLTGNVNKYIVSAYWRQSYITPSSTTTTQTGDLDFSDANTQLNILFNKEY